MTSIDTRKNTLLADSRYSFGFGAPGDLALPIVASYRVFLDQEYNWILPFEEFAEDFLQQLWSNYFRKYLVSEKIAGNTVGAKMLVATWNTVVIGFIAFKRGSHLSLLFVRREFSGQGIGRALFTQCTDDLFDYSAKKLYL